MRRTTRSWSSAPRDLQIVEANPAAIRAIGGDQVGRDILRELAAEDREPFQRMLARVREHGRAPGMIVRLGRDGNPWLVRASQMATEPRPCSCCSSAPAGGGRDQLRIA